MIELRPYQHELVAAIAAAMQAKRRPVVTVPTGAGKTEIAIEIMRKATATDRRALVVTERKNLCTQWRERLLSRGIHAGVIQADNTVATYADIIVGTVQSLRVRGAPENTGLIVIDECHILHKAHDEILAKFPEANVMGLTATPLRVGLGLRFDSVIQGPKIAALITDGYLVKPRYFAPNAEEIEKALRDVGVLAREFKLDELSIAMRKKAIMGDVVGTWQRLGEDRQTIAFCVDKQHARDLAAEFMAAGISADVVLDDTDDDDRARLFSAFANRSLRVLCSVGVLGIGFDSPIASCAILARPTLSLSLHVQQGGRILRPYPGKTDAIVLDHAANTLRHGRLEDFTPPSDLSQVDEKTDKRSRKDPPQAWICRNCEAVNALAADLCLECGNPRRKYTNAVVLEAPLRPLGDVVTYSDAEPQHIYDFYRMARWYGESRGMRNATGWAYYATARRFEMSEEVARARIRWDWRGHSPIAADAATARWFRQDWKRARMLKQTKHNDTREAIRA